MKKRSFILGSAAMAVHSAVLPMAFGVPDLKRNLPGKYKLTYSGTFLKIEATKYYHADGTYESVGKASILGIEKALIHSGRWKLDKGDLVYILSKSSTPSEAPVGVPLRFKVTGHDGKTLKYRDVARDKDYSEKRIGDAKKAKPAAK